MKITKKANKNCRRKCLLIETMSFNYVYNKTNFITYNYITVKTFLQGVIKPLSMTNMQSPVTAINYGKYCDTTPKNVLSQSFPLHDWCRSFYDTVTPLFKKSSINKKGTGLYLYDLFLIL